MTHCWSVGIVRVKVMDTKWQLKVHLWEVLRVSLDTDRGRWHFLVGVVA